MSKMDRPCYEKTFVGFDDPEVFLRKAIKWLKAQGHIFVKEIVYRPGEQDSLIIYYEGFPPTDPRMMEYWEQEMGKTHPKKRGDIK